MRNHVFMFQPKFVDLVHAGLKTQTVRGVRKYPISEGDTLSLRCWTGKPYRSKQRILRTATAVEYLPVVYGRQVYELRENGIDLSMDDIEDFAEADGFESAKEMFQWFEKTHGLPFKGMVTYWA